MRKIFYNASLPRSGSTLLQNILAQNPDIYATATSGVSTLIHTSKLNFSMLSEFASQDRDQMNKAFLGFLKGGIEGFQYNLTDRKYIIDKNISWANDFYLLKTIFDDEKPKIILMVRDLREVIASMEYQFRFTAYRSYPDVDHAELKLTTLEKRIKRWCETSPFGLSLDFLTDVFISGTDKDIFFMRYEDFCKFPEPIMKSLYEYLEIPYFSHDFNNIEQFTEQNDAYYIFNHKIRKELKPVEPKAMEIIGKGACEYIYSNYEWFFKKFNYSI
jgi:sulfotransferase